MTGCQKMTGGKRKSRSNEKKGKKGKKSKSRTKQRGGSFVAVLKEALVPFGFVLANNKYGKTKRRRGRKGRKSRRRRRTRRR